MLSLLVSQWTNLFWVEKAEVVLQCEQLFQYAARHSTESCSAWQRTQQMFSRLCTDPGLLALGAWQSLSVVAVSTSLRPLWPKPLCIPLNACRKKSDSSFSLRVIRYWGGCRVKYYGFNHILLECFHNLYERKQTVLFSKRRSFIHVCVNLNTSQHEQS